MVRNTMKLALALVVVLGASRACATEQHPTDAEVRRANARLSGDR